MFKNGQQLFDIGNDSVIRGNFAEAAEKYSVASKKFAKIGDVTNANIANALALLMRVATSDNVSTYEQVANIFGTLGKITLKIGIHDIPSQTIVNECVLISSEMRAMSLSNDTPTAQNNKAKNLKAVGIQYQYIIRDSTFKNQINSELESVIYLKIMNICEFW